MNEERTEIQPTPDDRTEVQKAIDLAWRVDGLYSLLRIKGDLDLAQRVQNAVMEAFILKPEDSFAAKAISDYLTDVIEANGGYDSGSRRYDDRPVDVEIPDFLAAPRLPGMDDDTA